MTTVQDLLPGDLVTSGAARAVFIASCPHPVWHSWLLVIWRMGDGSIGLDVLRPGDEVGDVQPIKPAARAERLAEALSSDKPAGGQSGDWLEGFPGPYEWRKAKGT